MNLRKLLFLPALTLLFFLGSCSSIGSLGGSAGSLLSLVQGNPKLSKFMTLTQAAGLSSLLSGSSPITLLAPSDNAFASLGVSKFQDFLSPDNKSMLTDILKNHMVSGSLTAKDMAKEGQLTNLLGSSLDVSGSGKNLSVGGASLLEKDMKAENGMIQMIDKVLMP
ncbi:fasciclin domain-containing protein [Persicobacter psychrovividus]|uniref:FAS1 domain-containing protein n=1 Tax=Persicobacter psychrovividus TaxID=387638 RepID=A0ABM7VH13_9BACT|nr:hypothetical protein PEPS_25310 [Persicobacter psychrovividus]